MNNKSLAIKFKNGKSNDFQIIEEIDLMHFTNQSLQFNEASVDEAWEVLCQKYPKLCAVKEWTYPKVKVVYVQSVTTYQEVK